MDATLAMEAINVLADDTLENTAVHELNQGHVSLRRSSLLNGRVEGHSICIGQRLPLSLEILLEFLLHGRFLPAAGTSLKHSTIS